MKRVGQLYVKTHEPNNLRLAFCKAKRGKVGRADVLDFQRSLNQNLLSIGHDSRQWLQAIYRKTHKFLDHRLGLELKPGNINRTNRGLPFLGYVIFPERVTLGKRSRSRFRRKLRTAYQNLNRNVWTELDFARHVRSLIAFTDHADNAVEFRRKAEHGIGLQERLEPCLSGRQLEQQSSELPLRESKQERAWQPEQQPGVSGRAPFSSEESTDVEL